MKKKVLIVDDSSTIRKILKQIISTSDLLEVVGEAEDPYQARELIKKLDPDVLTLDIEMPKMDGLSFLKNIMRLRPMPVVMISTLTEQGSDIAMQALEIGAVDYVPKPTDIRKLGVEDFQGLIVDKIVAASRANMSVLADKGTRSDNKPKPVGGYQPDANGLILIGSSTGGIEAFTSVIETFPVNCPPTVIVQHIPPVFSTSLAKRLDGTLKIGVHEASDGQTIEPGNVYIAPGGAHLEIRQRQSELYCCKSDAPAVNNHKPSVDVMFDSALQLKGRKIVAAVLTGMGKDGAAGLKKLKDEKAHTVIQDESSSVVWGMPKAAYEIGAHCEVLPLDKIGRALLSKVGAFK